MLRLFLVFGLALGAAPKLSPGDHRRTVEVDGRAREYLVHVPERLRDVASWPVVLVFHGGASDAAETVGFTGLNLKADAAGFLAVYPEGIGTRRRTQTWNAGNCCGQAMQQDVDDVAFVRVLLEDLSRAAPVDARHVYATGMSNGAMLCYLLASQLADRIAAIAPVSGPMGTESCAPSRPVPVCHFHGTDDAFAPYGGGVGARSLSRTNFLSVEHSVRTWAEANGCDRDPTVTPLPNRARDRTRVTRTTYGGCKQGAEVILYSIEGGGHTWPGHDPKRRYLGRSTHDIDANDVMWEFFEKHPLR